MKNEDELARIRHEYGRMSGTGKEFHMNGYMENLVKPTPVIDEKRLKECITDRISDITEGFELEDISEQNHAVIFDLDFDGYKVKFKGGIIRYRDASRMGSGAYTYLFDVMGDAKVYDGEKMVYFLKYFEKDFETEFVYNEMSYYGCKESDF